MIFMKRIIQLEHAIIFVCSVIIAFTFCLVVLLRYGFQSDLFAYEEWILTIAFLLYFIGGAAATAGNAHIKADIVLELIRSEKSRNGFQCIVMVLETIIGAFLTWYAVLMVLNEFVRWPNIPTSPCLQDSVGGTPDLHPGRFFPDDRPCCAACSQILQVLSRRPLPGWARHAAERGVNSWFFWPYS